MRTGPNYSFAGLAPNLGGLNAEISAIITKRGGIFPQEILSKTVIADVFDVLLSRFHNNCRFCKGELYKDKPREIHFAFIYNTEINALAYASPNEDFDFVGINVGAVFTLIDVFGRLLSHQDFLADVGNSAIEDGRRSYIPFLASDVVMNGVNSGPTVPNCDIRNAYCGFMLQSALDFLFYHEISHLRNGHLEWKRKYSEANFYEEAIRDRKNGDGITSQAFEMDADCGAILCVLNKSYDIFNRIETGEYFENRDFAIIAFGDRKNLVRLIFISTYILFRIFSNGTWDFLNQDNASYPYPPIRQIWITETIFTLFKNRPSYNYDADQYRDHAPEFILEAEKGISLILNDEIDARGILSVTDSELARAHLAKVKARWAEIRPQLLDFKRGGNLAE